MNKNELYESFVSKCSKNITEQAMARAVALLLLSLILVSFSDGRARGRCARGRQSPCL